MEDQGLKDQTHVFAIGEYLFAACGALIS